MRQVLFHIGPVPIYGFGMMLFITFAACYWLVGRRAEKEGIAKQHLQDLAVWLFVGGLIGARIWFMIQDKNSTFWPPWNFFRIWEGGLVFYGSAVGGLVAFFVAYFFIIRKHGLSVLQLGDILAPCIALGLSLGRIGCLLNGCCWGHVACPDCLQVTFPLSAPPRFALVHDGLQTAAGFALDDRDRTGRTVAAVETGSPAAQTGGLKAGDVIVEADGQPIHQYADLWNHFGGDWPRGKTDLQLTVQRGAETIALPAFEPRTLGLHPTQFYETVSTALILLLLLAYEPFQKRKGELLVILMLCYSVHRFLNESLRNDTVPPIDSLFGWKVTLTQSQWGSIVVFAGGIALLLWLLRRPKVAPPAAPASETVVEAGEQVQAL
jgi:phosphatidylglycerol:prolipoprotein diacylglycerol transferase